MKRYFPTVTFRVAVALVFIGSPAVAQDDPDAPELAALEKAANTFVEAYNRGNAEALAALFLPDGEITLSGGNVVSGREAITAFYEDVFAGEEDPQGAIEAGAVRFLSPTLAVEDGTFHVTTPAGEIVSHPYTALQVRQDDGSWLTASVRDSLKDTAPPSEKMLALEWLVGDWKVEKNGITTWLAFTWSDDGPYIDGRALSEEAGASSTTATWRIGWNPSREGYVSWGFDALGGYNFSEWTGTDTGWLLRTRGVTADGETNQSTQTLEPDPSGEFLTWSQRDLVVGGQLQDDHSVKIVKRPPDPGAESAETDAE